jgi:hypothetical protein
MSENELKVDDRKLRRAIQRIYAGFETKVPDFEGGKCKNYILVTLTTPEGSEVEMHRAWRKFIMRLRRRGMGREYYCVREWNKRGTCQHIHGIFRAGYMEAQAIRSQWAASIGQDGRNIWTHIDRLYGGYRGIAKYLTKYLIKGQTDYEGLRGTPECPRARGYWYAYEWVYRGWRSFSALAYRGGKMVQNEILHDMPTQIERKLYMVYKILKNFDTITSGSWTKTMEKQLRVCGLIVRYPEGFVFNG